MCRTTGWRCLHPRCIYNLGVCVRSDPNLTCLVSLLLSFVFLRWFKLRRFFPSPPSWVVGWFHCLRYSNFYYVSNDSANICIPVVSFVSSCYLSSCSMLTSNSIFLLSWGPRMHLLCSCNCHFDCLPHRVQYWSHFQCAELLRELLRLLPSSKPFFEWVML